jgi:hypothetical protein
VSSASNSHVLYYNNATYTGTTTINSFNTANTTLLGARYTSGSIDLHFDGKLADIAFWSVALTASEVAALYKGYSPQQIRPESLVAHYPCGGLYGRNSLDRWKSKLDLTDTNSPTYTDHPRIIYPQDAWCGSYGAGAAPTSNRRRRILMRHA